MSKSLTHGGKFTPTTMKNALLVIAVLQGAAAVELLRVPSSAALCAPTRQLLAAALVTGASAHSPGTHAEAHESGAHGMRTGL